MYLNVLVNDYGEYSQSMMLKINSIIYNEPATVIIWDDGTKTISKCAEGDVYDKQIGAYICIAKKLLKLNKTSIRKIMKEFDKTP